MLTKLPAHKPFDPSHLPGLACWYKATPEGYKDMLTGEILAPTRFDPASGHWFCTAADHNAAMSVVRDRYPMPDHVVTPPPSPAP